MHTPEILYLSMDKLFIFPVLTALVDWCCTAICILLSTQTQNKSGGYKQYVPPHKPGVLNGCRSLLVQSVSPFSMPIQVCHKEAKQLLRTAVSILKQQPQLLGAGVNCIVFALDLLRSWPDAGHGQVQSITRAPDVKAVCGV